MSSVTVSPAPTTARFRRWQAITLTTLFGGYCGYYVCRSNLSVAAPLLLAEFGPTGLTKDHIGWVASAGTAAYVLGKVANGLLTDRFGGRRMFLAGMVLSVIATLVFGAVTGFLAFTLVWFVNRYAQSAGWGPMVQMASRWFPHTAHATVMGILSTSYLIGDAGARLYLGELLGMGFGWRELFAASAVTLVGVAVLTSLLLRSSPRDLGLEEPPAAPTTEPEQPIEGVLSLREQLAPLVSGPTFWVVCFMNAGMTLLREAFTTWSPTYLAETTGLTPAQAAVGSAVFPLVGAVSALLAGIVSDRWRGRRGMVIALALTGLVGVLTALALVPVAGQPWVAVGLLAATAFLLTGPYSFCAGVMALDLGGKRRAATAAGLIDAAGYAGAILSGIGVGALAQRAGWPFTFAALAGVAGLTALVATGYGLWCERPAQDQIVSQ